MLKKISWSLGILVLASVLLLAGGYYYLILMPQPVTEGELKVEGFQNDVKVLRDRWGVPHIYAENEHDLFMAQGFIQAQDRLWQMETNRRVAAGRLSEILGPDTLEVDRLLRTLGLMRAARREIATYNEKDLMILRAYSEGINAFIHHKKKRLPVEFRLLKVTPEPWRPEDSIAWAKFMALLGSKNWQEEIVRALLTKRLGPEKAKALFGFKRPETPTVLPSPLAQALLSQTKRPLNCPMIPALGGASNNWAVHGSRTATGAPLLANDMHLQVRIPSIWYEMHLVSGEYDVIGLSLAGVPGIIAGHNRYLAWGITFAYTDVQDLFLERMSPDDPNQYLFKGAWLNCKIIKEPIRVKGNDKPFIHEVRRTRHGPIISPLISEARLPGHALSLKWSAHEPGDMMPTVRRLNLARNWEDFKAAAQDWAEPALNLVYADRSGNIGYLLASRVPVRKGGPGRGPFTGWTGKHEWKGYLPAKEKPFLLNPARGFVATANNRIVGPDYPHYLSDDYATGFRAARIEEFLSGKDKFSKADFRNLQGDFKCLPAEGFVAAIDNMRVRDTEAKDLLKRLRAWDRSLSPESSGGAIYSVLFYRLLENTFRDELGDLSQRFFGVGLTYLEPLNRFVGHSRIILQKLMVNAESLWFDDIHTSQRETLSDMLEKSLVETAAFLKQKLGSDPSAWRWGMLHRVDIKHPLGKVRPLDKILNLGPFEGGGHFSTVLQSAVRPGMDFKLNGWTASNRHIYDLKDWDRSLANIVPGQSGLYGNPHYDDQMELWLNVDHHPLYYSRSKVESESKSILILKP